MKKIDRREFINLCKTAGFASLFPFGNPLFASSIARSSLGKNNSNDGLLEWPVHVQEFPTMELDGKGNPWVAVIERDIEEKKIKLFSYKQSTLYEMAVIAPKDITGLADPIIRPYGDAMIMVFSFEKVHKWQIAYAIIDDENENPQINEIKHPGTTNIAPSVAVCPDKSIWILWESNASGNRSIYSCKITDNQQSTAERLSDKEANCYNPTIVALPNNTLFAAWDSVRNSSADIYGAWHKNGKWGKESRLTADPRMEKHPYLTNFENDVWMCWEAQSYLERYSNNLTEQRIVVAKLQDGQLLTPKGFFEQVTPDTHKDSKTTDTPWIAHYDHNPEKKYNLVRPRISFDKQGTLWVTAREFMSLRQEGPKPVAWHYKGGTWSDKKVLIKQNGKRQAVEISFNNNQGFVVYQYDDLPPGTGDFLGIDRAWKSGFAISEVPVSSDSTGYNTLELEPLKMPPTTFSLKENMKTINAALPRQSVKHKGDDLHLFFGDLHNHSDVSICRRSWNPTSKDYYAICRDVERLDFCALTDHAYNLDPAQWDFIQEQVRSNHSDDNFVTFLAQEWTSSGHPPGAPKEEQGYGHHNVIFLDPYFNHFYDSYDGDINPRMLWDALIADGADFICIPHQLADMGTNIPIAWEYVDEKLQPVAEIFQGRESYEYLGCPRQAPHGAKVKGDYLQDVWERGDIIGVIASPDHWGGIGKAAVWAKDLSRESIFEAIRARHTFGTTGSKMGLVFQTKDAFMGDKVQLSSKPDFNFKMKGIAASPIKEVVIFRNNKIVFSASPQKKEVNIEWKDTEEVHTPTWYYTRMHCEDNEMAWSSPIWFL